MIRRPAHKTEAVDWPAHFAKQAERSRSSAVRRFFETGVPAPDTPLRDTPLAALDFETTGLDPRRHAIVSVGVLPFTLDRIRPHGGQYWVVKPPRPLTRQSVTFHRLTHAETQQAPDLGEILDDLLATLAGRVVVVHYRNIERPFLFEAIRARLGDEVVFPVIDTMEIEARYHRESRWAKLKQLVGRRPASIRLADSRTRYGLPPYQPHHALVDAWATAELLQAQVARHYSPETPVGDLWR